MPATPTQPAARPRPADQAVRYRTVFVDWTKVGPALAQRAAKQTPAPPARTRVTTVDHEVAAVRKNVQDAARAVLTWLAAAVSHEDGLDLDAVLDACLRPGPDSRGVNFNALTEQINQTLGTDLTAKRVRTAVRHLRKAHTQQAKAKAKADTTPTLSTLDASLALRQRLIEARDAHDTADATQRTDTALLILSAVRSAAGRLIDNGFGEGIPQSVDGPAIAARFEALGAAHAAGRDRALDRLLRTLRDCDGEPEADMRLVLDGSRVVGDLAGRDSLPGVLGRLNVLVAGRYLLESQDYTTQLLALADRAEALHDDPATKKLLRHARGLAQDPRLPTPLRVASYCLNNAATHLLDRLFDGRLLGEHHLARAERCIARMMQRDSGFQLLRVTRLIHALTAAHLGRDDRPVDALLTGWGESATLAVLEDLARFDNNELVIAAANHHARRVYPALARRVIRAA